MPKVFKLTLIIEDSYEKDPFSSEGLKELVVEKLDLDSIRGLEVTDSICTLLNDIN